MAGSLRAIGSPWSRQVCAAQYFQSVRFLWVPARFVWWSSDTGLWGAMAAEIPSVSLTVSWMHCNSVLIVRRVQQPVYCVERRGDLQGRSFLRSLSFCSCGRCSWDAGRTGCNWRSKKERKLLLGQHMKTDFIISPIMMRGPPSDSVCS